jgi:transposase-like protein
MDQRVQFIADYQRDVFDVTELARRYGISRKTAYKWIDRYDVGGPAGLVDRSRRPACCPHETAPRRGTRTECGWLQASQPTATARRG